MVGSFHNTRLFLIGLEVSRYKSPTIIIRVKELIIGMRSR